MLKEGDKLLGFGKEQRNISERMRDIPTKLQNELQENKRRVYQKIGTSFEDSKFNDTKSKYSVANNRIASAITQRSMKNI